MRDRTGAARGDADREVVDSVVVQLLALSNNEEACRLLGVDGVLVEQVDISFLDDALDYVSYDIATAVFDAQSEHATVATTPMLAMLVAELKLCRLLSVRLDQHDLVQRVMEQMRGLEA